MTKLIVRLPDNSQPGSFMRRMEMLRAYDAFTDDKAAERTKILALRELYERVIAVCATDDGTPVAEALEQVSAADFDALVQLYLSGAGETIPNRSDGGSRSGPPVLESRPSGS
jgi:hypothetical protein